MKFCSERLFLQFTGGLIFRASILTAYNYLSTLLIWLRKWIWAYVHSVLIFFQNIDSWGFSVLLRSPKLYTYLLEIKQMTLITQVKSKRFPCYASS